MNKLVKVLITAACAVTLVVGSVAATVAYLTDMTTTVENTFTAGNITISLEDDKPHINKMVPGVAFDKNPEITVNANSEKCWLFVKIDKYNGFDNFMTFTVDTGDTAWTALDGVSGVYYRLVDETTADQTFKVISDGKITVKSNVTKDELNALFADNATVPALNFTAYAVQYATFENSVSDAWAVFNPTTPDSNS